MSEHVGRRSQSDGRQSHCAENDADSRAFLDVVETRWGVPIFQYRFMICFQ
jgi:hypothetical protein